MSSVNDFIEKAILAAVKKRVAEVTAEEIDAAILRIKARIGSEVDAIALSVSRSYDMESFSDRLIITVRKPHQGG